MRKRKKYIRKPCNEPNCPRKVYCRGLCRPHYERIREEVLDKDPPHGWWSDAFNADRNRYHGRG